MAINALNLDGGSDFVVKFGIPVTILIEMAVDTMHPFVDVDRRHVYRFFKFFRVGV